VTPHSDFFRLLHFFLQRQTPAADQANGSDMRTKPGYGMKLAAVMHYKVH
jgi:hypothetical protein